MIITPDKPPRITITVDTPNGLSATWTIEAQSLQGLEPIGWAEVAKARVIDLLRSAGWYRRVVSPTMYPASIKALIQAIDMHRLSTGYRMPSRIVANREQIESWSGHPDPDRRWTHIFGVELIEGPKECPPEVQTVTPVVEE